MERGERMFKSSGLVSNKADAITLESKERDTVDIDGTYCIAHPQTFFTSFSSADQSSSFCYEDGLA